MYCVCCGQIIRWPSKTGSQGVHPPGQELEVKYSLRENFANFWRRGVALWIDGIILSLLGATLNYIIGSLSVPDTVGALSVVEWLNSLAFSIFGYQVPLLIAPIAWVYYAFFESSEMQATPGKMFFGLMVSDMYGNKCSFMRASNRYFGKILSSVLLGLGYFVVLFTPRRQALHDLLAGCLVMN
jgi:uncharacterized RDD family membrane protein YckC